MAPKRDTEVSRLELELSDMSFEAHQLAANSRALCDALAEFGETASLFFLDDPNLADRKSACDEALTELELISRFGAQERKTPLGKPYLRPRFSKKGRRR